MIVYLARDIPAFVMYCVNGESGSSLLIESTDSMICSVFSLHTCQLPDKMFLDIGSNFPVVFSKMFLVLILTIIDDYK